jgi:hypothetical protein
VGEENVFTYTKGDVHEWGAWFQAGYNFTPELSLWGVYGTTRDNVGEVNYNGGGRFANSVAGGMLQYRQGGFAFGPELYHVETKSTVAAGGGAPDGVMDGIQLLISGMYFF